MRNLIKACIALDDAPHYDHFVAILSDGEMSALRNIRKYTREYSKIPKIVCLCGSTKFKLQFELASKREGLDGNIVLTVACFGHNGDLSIEECSDGHPIKILLDELHKRKIDLADEILVIDVDKYIGISTKSEIEYAKSNKKLIRYWSEEMK